MCCIALILCIAVILCDTPAYLLYHDGRTILCGWCWAAACAKMNTQCAVSNADSVCFYFPPETRGKLEQVLGNWEELDEGRGL